MMIVGFGSNIRPAEHLPRALRALRARADVLALSTVWETPPVGAAGPNFYNAAAWVAAPYSPERFKQAVLRPIEAALGRRRTADPNSPRPIDLDILVVGRRVVDEDVWRYAHWAVPVAEIAPDLRHPHSGERLETIAARLAAATPLQVVVVPGWR